MTTSLNVPHHVTNHMTMYMGHALVMCKSHDPINDVEPFPLPSTTQVSGGEGLGQYAHRLTCTPFHLTLPALMSSLSCCTLLYIICTSSVIQLLFNCPRLSHSSLPLWLNLISRFISFTYHNQFIWITLTVTVYITLQVEVAILQNGVCRNESAIKGCVSVSVSIPDHST